MAKDIYVAREEDSAPATLWHNFIGGLHLHQQYGLIVVPPYGRRLTSGQVLIEHLPIAYDLVAFKPDRLRSISRFDVVLQPKQVNENYTIWNELCKFSYVVIGKYKLDVSFLLHLLLNLILV